MSEYKSRPNVSHTNAARSNSSQNPRVDKSKNINQNTQPAKKPSNKQLCYPFPDTEDYKFDPLPEPKYTFIKTDRAIQIDNVLMIKSAIIAVENNASNDRTIIVYMSNGIRHMFTRTKPRDCYELFDKLLVAMQSDK
jgi:hypothetical protein